MSRTVQAIDRGFSRSGWASLFWLCMIGLLSSVDFQLVYLLLQPVKSELRLSDAQLGIVTGTAVAVIMAVAAFPIGWAADRFGRRRVLACSVLFWSAMTAACGLAKSFEGFLLASAGLAFGEAGIYGIIYAMVPDIVADRHRNLANTVLLSVLVLSAGLGLIVGGAILGYMETLRLGDWSAWRVVFLSAGALGIPFSMMAFGVKPLKASSMSTAAIANAQPVRFVGYMKKHGVTVFCIFLALNFYVTAWSLWMTWGPTLYTRSFGASASRAGQVIGWANLIGCMLALVMANVLHRWTHSRLQERFAIQMLLIGCALALPPLILMWVARAPDVFIYGYTLEIAFIVLAVSIAPMLLQDIAPQALRSRVAGLMAPIGLPIKVAVPPIAGLISDSLGSGGLMLAVCTVSGICLLLSVIGFALFERRYGRLVRDLKFQEQTAAETAVV